MMRIAARIFCLSILLFAVPHSAWGQGNPPKSPDDPLLLKSDPLPDGAVHRFGTNRLRLPAPAGYFLFNPDDSVLMVGCANEVRFWETKSWREIWRLEALAFSSSPDGKHVARQTGERNIEIWNAEKKTLAHTVDITRLGRNVRIFDIEFNHKGDGVWLGISGIGLWLYNWNKSDVVTRINAPDIFEGSLCISRDRKVVAIRRHSERISIYDAVAGTLLRDIITPRSADMLSLSHDGKFVASHNQGGQTKFWYTATGRSVSFLPEPIKKPNPDGERDDDIADDPALYGSLLFDAKGERIVLTGRLTVVDRKAKKIVAEDPPEGPFGLTGAISNNNQIVVVACADGSVDVRQMETLKPAVNDTFPRGAAISVAFSHDGKQLATLNDSGGGEVRTWQLDDFSFGKRFVADVNLYGNVFRNGLGGGFGGGMNVGYSRDHLHAHRLAFLPGDQRLALGGSAVWNVVSGSKVKTATTEHRLIRANADSRRWLLAKENAIQDVSELVLFDPKAKKELVKLPLEISAENCYPSRNIFAAMSRDGGVVALQSRPASQRDPNSGEAEFREGSLSVWDTRHDRPKKLFSTTFEQAPKSFDLAADGRFLVQQGAPSAAHPHRLWHIPSGLPLWKLDKDDAPTPRKKSSVARLPIDSDVFIDYNVDFEESHEGCLLSISPDGQFFVESGDAGIAVRETLSGARLMTLPASEGKICDLAFSPDARLLATASRDSTVTLWKIPPFAAAQVGRWNRDQFETQWNKLRGDGLTAFQAMADLHAGGDEAVAKLRQLIGQEIVDEQQQILGALADLGSPKFLVREKATSRLERWGYRLKPYLLEAMSQASDLEQKRRLTALYERYMSGGIDPNELRLGRCTYLLECIGTPAAREVLEQIARGNPNDMTVEAARAALARLAAKADMP